MIERKEVKTFSVDFKCPKCNIGYLRPTGNALMTYPVKYPHKCNNTSGNCDYIETFNEQYPYIEYNNEPLFDLNEAIKKINSLIRGEVKYDNGELIWYGEDSKEEDDDTLWNMYCEAAEVVRKEIPNCEVIDAWEDNDSSGFTIKINDKKNN